MRKSGCLAREHTPEIIISDEFGERNVEGGQEIVNTLIRHLDLVAVTFSKDASSGGYEEDRIAGLVNGDKSALTGNMLTLETMKTTDNEKKTSSSTTSDFSSMPRRPTKSGGRPSTASTGGRRSNGQTSSDYVRPSTAGRYTAGGGKSRGSSGGSSSGGSSGGSSSGSSTNKNNPYQLPGATLLGGRDGYTGGTVSYSSVSRTGNSMMAGQSVTTPEQYRVNPQRRRMWKLDLQREKDVIRMNALVNKLETMRTDDAEAHLDKAHQFKMYQ